MDSAASLATAKEFHVGAGGMNRGDRLQSDLGKSPTY